MKSLGLGALRVVGCGPIASVLLAVGLPIPAGAERPYTLSILLQTDRPAYVVGETVRMRFIIINPGEMAAGTHGIYYKPELTIVDGRGNAVKNVRGDWEPVYGGGAALMIRSQFVSGKTALQTYGWRYARVWRQWWSYYFDGPGSYTIIANGSLADAVVKASPPVTIQILTKSMARSQAPAALSDSRTNALFGNLVNEYVSLRSALVERGDFRQTLGDWEQRQKNYRIESMGFRVRATPRRRTCK